MARFVLLLALCVFPAIVSAVRPVRNPLVVEGKVYCDSCRAGFETSAATYIAGAKVRVECKDRKTLELVYSQEAKTDSSGTYKISVSEEHADQLCDTLLVSSPIKDCSSPSEGRDRSRVILTSYNGIVSQTRYANAMGFMKDQALDGCHQILSQYQEDDF